LFIDKLNLPNDIEIEKLAEIYAEQECSAYTNDYYGYINGAKDLKKAIEINLEN